MMIYTYICFTEHGTATQIGNKIVRAKNDAMICNLTCLIYKLVDYMHIAQVRD